MAKNILTRLKMDKKTINKIQMIFEELCTVYLLEKEEFRLLTFHKFFP